MARFEQDPLRLNHPVTPSGKEYNLRLIQRASAVFSTLLNLLPSTYIATVESANYTLDLKAIGIEIARLELALEDVDTDRSALTARPEFLYQVLGYLLFLNGKIPPVSFDSEEFRKFFLSVLRLYFSGSVPSTMKGAAELLFSTGVTITENFLLLRGGASGLDISDQWGFTITLDNNNSFPPDFFNLDSALRQLIDVLRPAHTLFRFRVLFTDKYNPNDGQGVLDAMRWRMSNYYYEDARKYCEGILDKDTKGHKDSVVVTDEDHSWAFLDITVGACTYSTPGTQPTCGLLSSCGTGGSPFGPL